MGARGPQSNDALALASVTVQNRPEPAAGLSSEQKFEWLTIVNEYSGTEFTKPLLPLLEAYCRHRVCLRHVGKLIDDLESEDVLDVKDYDRLLKMQERESRTLASLAVRLGFAKSTAREAPKQKASLNAGEYGYNKD